MSTSRRRYHHGDLPGSFLREAGILLEKQGLERLRMRALARRARVSHNAPYRHFPDRESLLAALATEGFGALGRALEAASGPHALGEAYVRFALVNPQRFRLMFGGGLSLAAHPQLRAQAMRAYEGLLRAFQGIETAYGAPVAAAAAWSLVHGLAQLLLDGHFPEATQQGREREPFIRSVIGAIRFASRPAQPA